MGMIVRNEKTYTGISSASLSTLTDVALETPVNGQGLVYNEETQMWTNGNVASGGFSGGSYFPEYFYRVVTNSIDGDYASIKLYKYNYLSGEVLKEQLVYFWDCRDNAVVFDNALSLYYNQDTFNFELTTLIWLIDEETNQEYLKNDKLLTWNYTTSIDKKYRTIANLENDLLTLKNDVAVELTTPTTADTEWNCSIGMITDFTTVGNIFVYFNDDENYSSTIDISLTRGTNIIDNKLYIPENTSKVRFITSYGYIISVGLCLGERMAYLTSNNTELEDGIYITSGTATGDNYDYYEPFMEGLTLGSNEGWRPNDLPAWLMIELPEPRSISHFVMYNRKSYTQGPKNVIFQGSNDGEIWIDLKEFIFMEEATKNVAREVVVNNHQKFSKYRWYITSAHTDGVIAKIDLYFMKDTVYKTFIDRAPVIINDNLPIYLGGQVLFDNFSTSSTTRKNFWVLYKNDISKIFVMPLDIPEGYVLKYRLSASIWTNDGNTLSIGINGKPLISTTTWSAETFTYQLFSDLFTFDEFDDEYAYTHTTTNLGYNLYGINDKSGTGYANKITIHGYLVKENPVDVPSSSNSQSSVNYSTEEQIIGTWIDGSTLYQKTYTGTFASNNTASSAIDFIDVSSLNIKDLVELNMILYSETLGQNLKTPFYLASNNLAYPWHNVIDNNIGAFVGTIAGSGTYKLTIQYIK